MKMNHHTVLLETVNGPHGEPEELCSDLPTQFLEESF